MKIDISKLIDRKSNEIDVIEKIVLKDLYRGNEIISTDDLTIEGKIVNVNGQIIFSGVLKGNLKTQCSRCLDDVIEPLSITFDEIIFSKDDYEPITHLEENCIDMEDFVEGLFLLKLDMKFLCRDDCKGLCGKCGANLNKDECNCEKDNLDIRLMELKKLL